MLDDLLAFMRKDFDDEALELEFNAKIDRFNLKLGQFLTLGIFAAMFILALGDFFFGEHNEEMRPLIWARLSMGAAMLPAVILLYQERPPLPPHRIVTASLLLGSLSCAWQLASTGSVAGLWFDLGYLLIGLSLLLLQGPRDRAILTGGLAFTWSLPYIIRGELILGHALAFVFLIIFTLITFSVGYTLSALSRSIAVQGAFIKNTLGRYLSAEITETVLSRGEESLSGEEREVTILFSDLRGYSSIIESLPPKQVITVLNTYFTAMQEIIEKHGGCTLEFLGDALLVVFNAPQHHDDHAAAAVRCAKDMRMRLKSLNDLWKSNRHEPEQRGSDAASWLRTGGTIEARIGIHTGMVIAGNLGSHLRMKYGVVGDVVNVAARLEGLNKELKSSILISRQTWRLLDEGLAGEATDHGLHSLKGREQRERAYSF
ncbi:MAG: adenylate/guanylate cyclase domain-containing protein [Myxococcota bacterium]|nr:adenylate/guanylate cyclase domain-containing protein [Myxococcota bacterium]